MSGPDLCPPWCTGTECGGYHEAVIGRFDDGLDHRAVVVVHQTGAGVPGVEVWAHRGSDADQVALSPSDALTLGAALGAADCLDEVNRFVRALGVAARMAAENQDGEAAAPRHGEVVDPATEVLEPGEVLVDAHGLRWAVDDEDPTKVMNEDGDAVPVTWVAGLYGPLTRPVEGEVAS